MPLGEWLKPPRSLLVILLLLTLVSVAALAWLGWKLLEQERMAEAQRAQERLEQAADRITAKSRASLAEAEQRLETWISNPPSDLKTEEGLLLLLPAGNTFSAFPPGRLIFHPYRSPEPEAAPGLFEEGEALEFSQGQPRQAVEWYQRLAESKNAAIRAGALMRLGRVLRRMGRKEESAAAYRRLAAVRGAKVAGAPAELVARQALYELSGDGPEALREGLVAGRWHLTRGQFEFYWSTVSRGEPAPRDPATLAEAAAAAWKDREHKPAMLWVDGWPWFLIWRGQAALVLKPESLLKQDAGVFCAMVDNDGRVLAGRKGGVGRAVVRTAAESELPWTLHFAAAQGPRKTGLQRFLLLAIAVMALFLMAGTYFVARAMRREMDVSRLQSDFVSAVSHEFCSPLTSMRQLSEMLALGRVPGEDRRQTYYQALVRETDRLQRLVEGLLNFGRMEAGASKYRHEELDVAVLAARAVAQFEPQIAESGRRIELSGEDGCRIEGDPEALSIALRNLVDNALKYSPDDATVWVEWGMENDSVVIRVRDKGLGVQASEREAIFQKFVRGSAAVAGNVKGTGVGLAMVRHIVEAHGGEVGVTSDPGQGSTFTMRIPVVKTA